jgi:hypothetical protein
MQDLKLYSVKKAILNQIIKENNLDKTKVFVNKKFGYIESDNKNDVSFLSTIFHGERFKIKYLSGCFYPFIISLGKIEK